jgi:dienelactone hydrolase
MSLFQRTIRFFFFLLGVGAAGLAAATALLTRRMVAPPRQSLWATPKDVGLAYEDIQFPAYDGARVAGWFVPAAGDGPHATIMLVHGWTWNRLGKSTDSLLDNLSGARTVDLLPVIHGLQSAGFNVLAFDQRNHGMSAAAAPTTFGLQEANDVIGAVDYLAQRRDVDRNRIGAIGFSTGANAVLFSIPNAPLLKAAILVQPTTPELFADRLSADMLGPFGQPVLILAELIYRALGGIGLRHISPVRAARAAHNVALLYVQGNRDPWGSFDDVADMVAATPNRIAPIYVDAARRTDGYRFVLNHPDACQAFFDTHLPPA